MARSKMLFCTSKPFTVYQIVLPVILTTVLGYLEQAGINTPFAQMGKLRLLAATCPRSFS